MTLPRSDDLAGRLLGERYELATRLGEGGMGVVYRGHDTMLRRDVAVKVFRDGATEVARTTSETHLLASLNHPALVTLYDAHLGAEEPRYLVMEYVDGPTLDERLRSGPLPRPVVARVAADLAEALHVVHQAGIVHRDVKPANVLLRAPGVAGEEFSAKLADFGIAHLVDATRLTTPGTIIGSAAYLSPEQVTGVDPRPSADIYSLGLVLLEALTGRRAFAQEGLREAVLARLSQDPVVPTEVGREWGALLTAMTARDPADRPTAMAVVDGARRLRSESTTAPTSSSATVGIPGSSATRTAVLPSETAVLPSETA
ncbi:serine/threonine-protein kinase, partial [Microbacterium sp. K24]|uniref:serine/threonine-protein kinase n=1 Tax=Microbacterium sp. K24 TaxID=2305446 RepID=UPI00109C8E48